MKNVTCTLSALAALTLAGAPLARAADAPPVQHVRGIVTKVAANEIVVETTSGASTVRIDGKTKIVGVVPASAAEIASGTFVGTANVPGATSTTARALEVVVFPRAMAGMGEGDYPWDLPAGSGHSAMTNGTVASHRSGSMMTNATVTGVKNGASKTVTLNYKGGSKSVTVAPGVPIVRIVPGKKSLLAIGAHVVAFQTNGVAARVVVGEQGAVPPM